jgi:hypothetical protein
MDLEPLRAANKTALARDELARGAVECASAGRLVPACYNDVTTMLTTSVGIRELKRDAARLVQRAARGDRVVVTRYGRASTPDGSSVLETIRRISRGSCFAA